MDQDSKYKEGKMKIIQDYLAGNVSGQDFIAAARANPEIPAWFQDLIPPGAEVLDGIKGYRIVTDEASGNTHVVLGNGVGFTHCVASHPFWRGIHDNCCLDILSGTVDMHEYFRITKDFNKPGKRLNAYDLLLSLARTRYPELKESDRFHKEFNFCLVVLGDMYDGPEIEEVLDEALYKIYQKPGTLKERKQEAKEFIRSFFHTEDRRYPHWAQAGEWPMGIHSAMKFISRKRDGDRVLFLFKDVDTGEEKIVEQFY